MALAAVLFDLDGTLLDTAPDMVGALNALRAEESLAPMPFDGIRSAVSHGAARVVKAGFPQADPEARCGFSSASWRSIAARSAAKPGCFRGWTRF